MSGTSAHTKPQTGRDPVIGLLPWHWNPCFPKPLWTEDRGGEIWGIQEEEQTMAHTQTRWYPITYSRTAAAEAAVAAAAAGPRVCIFSCIPSPDLRLQLGVRAMQPRRRTPHPPDRPGAAVAMWKTVVMAQRCAPDQTVVMNETLKGPIRATAAASESPVSRTHARAHTHSHTHTR